MLKRYLTIYLHFIKMNILRRIAQRFNLFVILIALCFNMSTYVFFIKVIYGHLSLIAGWDLHHSLLIIASTMFVEGLGWVSCAFMHDLTRRVKDGSLDFFIVKPIDTQVLISINRIDPEDASRFLIAGIVLIYAFRYLSPSLLNIGAYMLMMIFAYLIFYSMLVLINSISFWVVNVQGIGGFNEKILQITQYPADIYTGIMKTIFSFIIPLAFIATVPAKVLSGWYDWRLIAESFLIAAVFFYLSRKFFLFGLQHYSSASS